MSERVRVVRHDGALLAIKEPAADRTVSVEEEARLLARLQLPGVVEVVGVRRDPPGLVTHWVGSRTLAEVELPLEPDRAAALCLAVAGTLERLHRAGVVHGSVEPSHVLLDPRGRPVLCGFGSAGPIGAPVRRPATDRPPGDEARLDPADDVAGVARLLHHLLGTLPPRRMGRGARRRLRRWRALVRVADLGSTTEPQGRPSMVAFTRSVRRAAPDARLAPVSPAHPRPRPGARRADRSTPPAATEQRSGEARSDPRTRQPSGAHSVRAGLPALAAVVAVAATTYLGLSAWWSGDAAGDRTQPRSTTTAADRSPRPATVGSDRAATSAPSTTAGPTSTQAPATTSAPIAPETPPATEGATVVVHDGRRYAVGAEGDVALVGPWRCDGTDLVVLLRPEAGTVHLFDAWPTASGTLTARSVATVSGATGLVPVADGPGCAALVVTGPDGVLATLTAGDLS